MMQSDAWQAAVSPQEAELAAMRAVMAAIRDGLSLESTVQAGLEATLSCLGLDFGCVYVRRHDYLIRVANQGLALPFGPYTLLEAEDASWTTRPFVASLSDDRFAASLPQDVRGKAWMCLPLRIGRVTVGVMLVGAYGRRPSELPALRTGMAIAEPIAIGIDNAMRFEQVRGILNDTRDVIFRTDLRARWSYVNEAFQEVFGEPLGRALGRRVVAYVHPGYRRRLGDGLEILVPRGSVIGRQTVPFVVRGGKTRWMDVQARLLKDDRGEVVGVAGVLRDVSRQVLQNRQLAAANDKLRRHAKDLETANRELAEADRLKSEFLANISHELRTPLNFIMGYAELLQDGVPDEPTEGQREYLDFILEGSQRLEKLIVDLLHLGRIEAGRVELKPEPLALGQVFDQVVNDRAEEAAAAGQVLRGAVAAPEPMVTADPTRLRQVLDKLLDNAIKFAAGEGAVTITAAPVASSTPQFPEPVAVPGGGYVQITVTDQGQGVDAGRHALLFRKFVQADGSDTREHGGLGLGLVICKGLVELMGGEIALSSAGVGTGCQVAFTLPSARSPLAGAFAGAAPRSADA